MYVIDHGRWDKTNESWVKATPLLKEILGYTDNDIQNFINVQEKHYFPPFAINVTKEQITKIIQPFWDYDLNVFAFEYDDTTFKRVGLCNHIKDFNVNINSTPKLHYYDEPIISLEQRVDPFNPPSFDTSWVNLSLGINNQTKPTTPTITCPYCKSTDCKKISGLSKAGSVALWGIFALGKTTKQWHCNNCKSDF